MNRIVFSFAALILAVTAAVAPAQRLQREVRGVNSSDGDQAASRPARTVRVLTIGNSFAQNACKYLEEIAKDGSVDLVIGTANLGGCTLERHAALAKQSESDATIKPYNGLVGLDREMLSLQEYLAIEKWYEILTGNDAREIRFAPRGISESDKTFLRETAHAVSGLVAAGEQSK